MRAPKIGGESILVALLLSLFGLALALDQSYLSAPVQKDVIASVWEIAVVAIPMTLVVLTGGIDLSVGATMSLCAVVVGLCFESNFPAGGAVMAALLVGALAGAVNGLFVSKVKVHPLIVTLATMSAFYGLAEGVSQARPISGFPDVYARTLPTPIGPMALSGWVTALLAVLAILVLARTTFGQSLFSIGLNEEAARFSGLPVGRFKFWAYTLCGSAAGLAAIYYTSRRNTAKADIGHGLELDVVTAVVLGGTSIFGGRGGIVGTLLGVLLVHETRQFVSWHWERDELNLIVVGCLLILAVLANKAFERRKERSE